VKVTRSIFQLQGSRRKSEKRFCSARLLLSWLREDEKVKKVFFSASSLGQRISPSLRHPARPPRSPGELSHFRDDHRYD
jgi:hypothetical protein